MYLHLLNEDGSSWARAAYSIANAPSDGTTVLEFGIKTAGDFTKRASTLSPGDTLLFHGPWGVFTLKKEVQRVAYFAGGIGVTPLLCMAREACAMNLDADMIFFYSFRRPEEAAYLDELHALTAENPRLQLIPICTGASVTDWTGERGRMSADAMTRLLPNGADDYVICGPDAFMDDLKKILIERGVEPKKIRKESFG